MKDDLNLSLIPKIGSINDTMKTITPENILSNRKRMKIAHIVTGPQGFFFVLQLLEDYTFDEGKTVTKTLLTHQQFKEYFPTYENQVKKLEGKFVTVSVNKEGRLLNKEHELKEELIYDKEIQT